MHNSETKEFQSIKCTCNSVWCYSSVSFTENRLKAKKPLLIVGKCENQSKIFSEHRSSYGNLCMDPSNWQ